MTNHTDSNVREVSDSETMLRFTQLLCFVLVSVGSIMLSLTLYMLYYGRKEDALV